MFSQWKLKIVVTRWSRILAEPGKKPEQVPACCGIVLSAQFRAQLYHDIDGRKVLPCLTEGFTDKPFAAISIYRPGKRLPAGNKA